MAVLTDLFYAGCYWPALFRVSRSIYVIIGCVARSGAANWGAGTGLLAAIQMLFGGVAGSAIIALGGADRFCLTATVLLIMALCAALSFFLAPNSR